MTNKAEEAMRAIEVEEAMTTAKNARLLAQHLKDKKVRMLEFFGDNEAAGAYKLDEQEGGDVERNWCGTAACALGWATTHPDMPVLPSHFNTYGFMISWYEHTYFPAEGTWNAMFTGDLPNDGAAQRCLDWAEELELIYGE